MSAATFRYYKAETAPLSVTDATKRCLGHLLRDDSSTRVQLYHCYHVEGEWSDEMASELLETTNIQRPTPQQPGLLVEIGPLPNFESAWTTNASTICRAVGINAKLVLTRIVMVEPLKAEPSQDQRRSYVKAIHDQMTECEYVDGVPVAHKLLPADGDVAEYDQEQSGSEHSRHWFFKGKMVFDGKPMPQSMMDLVKATLRPGDNSVIALSDNSSAIRGYRVPLMRASEPGKPCAMQFTDKDMLITFTAETHNFPTAIAPFPGAETGTGGRIRDQHATGRGSLVVAGTTGYSVGNLHIPGYSLPWEDKTPSGHKFASALDIEIQASNGASDYGNKFGEPVIVGFTRSFGMNVGKERREYIKPIMFTGGVGSMLGDHKGKAEPKPGMQVVKIGGPAYRIGMGGSAASSTNVQTSDDAELDLNAVQRGDAEMEQKMNRVIRACVEMDESNPILSIHDQGAGGNGNVLKELVEPAGAVIDLDKLPIGDPTLTAVELWCCEYQENDALLVRTPQDAELFASLCRREGIPTAVVGEVNDTGRVKVLFKGQTVMDMPLSEMHGTRTFEDATDTESIVLRPLSFGDAGAPTVKQALDRVLRLVSVGSKAFLTNKVDRCVTGLIAQQQCCGPLHLPVSDYGLTALSYNSHHGACTSIGEQPIKGLIDPKAMARMTVAEALTNMSTCKVSALEDIKSSGNWMWPAKLSGEAVRMYQAVEAMCDVMRELGLVVDGGKDSLSMAVQTDGGEVVKCPGTLVVSLYCSVPDIRDKVTPDIKSPGSSSLILVRCNDKTRLGGSALAQTYSQLGDASPDVDDPRSLRSLFSTVQLLVTGGLIVAGHDRSDGGLIVTLLEMAFTGNCGFEITLPSADLANLFAEEVGVVVEVKHADLDDVMLLLQQQVDIDHVVLGVTTAEPKCLIRSRDSNTTVLDDDIRRLRDVWSETSFQLDRLQANPACVDQEREGLHHRRVPPRRSTYDVFIDPIVPTVSRPKIAIIREEGSNGDREMAAAFYQAGFEAWDIKTSDLIDGTITLDRFRGAAFVGGFSFADVLGAARGWASVIKHRLMDQFEAFRTRPDTFSLGVCNGCQLLTSLGWVQGKVVHNDSGRFESRWSTVKIMPSNSIMLNNMRDCILGIWVAHGEGKFVQGYQRPAVVYVDDEGHPTERYPFNPNGSIGGTAAVCSEDGRHLAIMPHPERCFLRWQCPEKNPIPWFKMFVNAFEWCVKTEAASV